MADDMIGNADERRRLLGELELERNQLMRNIETCRIRDIDRPFIGSWSLKDIVGHIASWEAEKVTARGCRYRADAAVSAREDGKPRRALGQVCHHRRRAEAAAVQRADEQNRERLARHGNGAEGELVTHLRRQRHQRAARGHEQDVRNPGLGDESR